MRCPSHPDVDTVGVMHWLPLVAMVIASAFPLPLIPLSLEQGNAMNGGGANHVDYRPQSTSQDGENKFIDMYGKENGKINVSGDSNEGLKPALKTEMEIRETWVGGTEVETLLEETDMSLLDTHPRVLFSSSPTPPKDPPLLLMLEAGLLTEDESPTWPTSRAKRSPLEGEVVDLRGERSVCEAVSNWVTDKRTAIDDHGRNVTVLTEVQLRTQRMRQYFFETRCRLPGRRGSPHELGLGLSGGSCLGVDRRQWVSECKAKHSYVRALTADTVKGVNWRWIRIESSCVCVLLSRVSRT